jgi:hypothetical protein
MFACPIIDGQVYLIPSEQWREDISVLGSAEYPSKPSEPEWTMSRRRDQIGPFLEAHRASDVLAREATRDTRRVATSVIEVDIVPLERSETEAARYQRTASSVAVNRRESNLVGRYAEYLERSGHSVVRLKIRTAEGDTLFSDIWVRDLQLLVEAKGDVDRASVRMALGQLIDYAQGADSECGRAVLLPERPSQGILELIHAGGAYAIWPSGDSFATSESTA